MREVKYRAWGPNCQTMWSWEEVKSIANHLGWENFNEGERTLMQQIGLKDDKGSDIFEGDVIRVQIDDSISIDYHVEYDNWNCNFFGVFIKQNGFNGSPNHNNRGFCDLRRERGIEVIGNIYENPELLN